MKSFIGEVILFCLKKLFVKLIPKPKSKFSGFLELTNFLTISESLIGKPKDWLYSIN